MADYKLTGNKVRVVNRCYKVKKHKLSQAKGIAWTVPGSGNSQTMPGIQSNDARHTVIAF